MQTLGSKKACVKPWEELWLQECLASWSAHACRTCTGHAPHAGGAALYLRAERCCPAVTSWAQAPLHAPLREAGPGVELKAQLLGQHWTRARPCCAVALGAVKVAHNKGTNTQLVAVNTARDGAQGVSTKQPSSVCSGGELPSPKAQKSSGSASVASHNARSYRYRTRKNPNVALGLEPNSNIFLF